VAPAGASLPAPRLARVARIALVRREVREVLAPGAVALLLSRADVLVEGDPGPAGAAGPSYWSVMVTVDLQRVALAVRERPDVATAERLAELLRHHPELRTRLRALALTAIAARLQQPASRLRGSVELSVRTEGPRILIDADVAIAANADGRGARPAPRGASPSRGQGR
jgi:hypothetical protein